MDNDIISPCTACELYTLAQHPCMQGVGPVPAKVMIVGEAPGAQEDLYGKPFVGASGEKLRNALKDVGINLDECYITNAVKCRPPMNATPNIKQIKACKPHLDAEIEAVKPEIIVAVGGIALKAFGIKQGITSVRGTVLDYNGIKVFPILHPAFILRQPQRERTFKADLAYLAREIQGKHRATDEGIPRTLVTTIDDLERMEADLLAKDTYAIGYDIETDYEETSNRIILLGLGKLDKNEKVTHVYAIPWEHPARSESALPLHRIQETVEKILEPKRPMKVAQNAYRFDNRHIRKRGIKPYLGYDLLLGAYLLDENSPHDLEFQAMTLLGSENWKSDVKYSVNYPLSKLAEYNFKDVIRMLQIVPIQRRLLASDKGLAKVFSYILMPAARMLEDVQEYGCWVDPVKFQETKTMLEAEKEAKYEELLATICEAVRERLPNIEDVDKKALAEEQLAAGYSGFNPGSPKQVGELLFGVLGLDILKRTEAGAPSTNGDILTMLNHPVAQAIVEWRKVAKLLSGYIHPWEEYLASSPDGRFHPTFKVHATVTGRLAATDPAIQTVPRESSVRSIITAPPGWVLVEADYSQIELRVACSIAQEPTMIQAFNEGQDLHSLTARDVVLGDPNAVVTKKERQDAKAINFGFLFCMSARGFRDYALANYGVSLTQKEAELRRHRYFQKYDGLSVWHRETKAIVRRDKQVRSPLGRIRRFPGINEVDKVMRSEMEREAINFTVQSTASDICLLAGIKLHKLLPQDKAHIVNFVHDAILFEVKEEYLDETIKTIHSVMTDMDTVLSDFAWCPSVPMEIEVKVGPWGNGKVWEIHKGGE